MSYIQLVSSPDALIRKEWTVDPKKAYFGLSERDQCGYLLQHALFLMVVFIISMTTILLRAASSLFLYHA